MTDPTARLAAAFGRDRVRRHAPLAGFTTFKVGGPAEWLVEVHGREEICRAVEIAREAGQRVTVLGGGSNVLVSDRGISGVVIRAHGGRIALLDESSVCADAGVTINALVRWTITHGCAGIEAWAGTPGTVGGAVFGNAHFQGRLIGDEIERVTLVNAMGEVADVRSTDMEFGYDTSRIQRTGEIVISADFRVSRGDPSTLRAIARESLAFRKRTQPLASASAGCIFRNPDPGLDRVPDGIPQSAGALVDRAGLKGLAIGGARVSATHGNFIVNDGGASADDIRALIARCREDVRARFGVQLREEIVYLGFDG